MLRKKFMMRGTAFTSASFRIVLALVFSGVLITSCSEQREKTPIIKNGVLDLRAFNFKTADALSLTGDWEFHWLKFLPGVEPEVKDSPAAFIPVPSVWNKHRIKGQLLPAHGYGTYRLKVLLNENPGPISLKVPAIGSAYQLYVNGQLLESGGTVGKSKSRSEFAYKPVIADIPAGLLQGENKTLDIAFTVSNFRQPFAGLWFVPQLGSRKVIRSIRDFNLVSEFTMVGLLLIMAAYHLILFLLRPKESLALYFAALCLFIATRVPLHQEMFVLDLFPSLPMDLILKMQYGSYYFCVPVVVMFLKKAFPDEMHKYLLWSLLGLTLPFCALTLIGSTQLIGESLVYYQGISVLSVFAALYIIIRALISKQPGARILMFGIFILLLSMLNDIMYANGWIYTGYLSKFGMVGLILSKSTLLSWRFYNSFAAVERLSSELHDLNQNLERKVESRTEELQNTLAQVNHLKFQQDADYYLTSLLIKPLAGNHTSGSLVSIDILESQYKKFQFRQKNVEIGGDYSYADTINLQGKDYTLVLNSDAMGKSMQGAGGALILGSVIRSVISRTQRTNEFQTRYPELWLQSCYQELQNVFLTFDCSMLISMVLGLIEDKAGLLYYINAEHPRLALYRDKQARFIEEDHSLMKIGVTQPDDKLTIQTFQLQQDDVLILGSDGRDDIILGTDEQGNRIINEDMNQFLQHVENGYGMLPEIQDSILASGGLIDDFSLLRIGYKEDLPLGESASNNEMSASLETAQKLYKGEELNRAAEVLSEILAQDEVNPAALKSLAKIHTRTRNFESAAILWAKYTGINPDDTKAIYNTSVVLRKVGKFSEAAQFGERLRLREPGWLRNLECLADTYLKLGNGEQALTVLNKIQELDPRNRKAATLRDLIAEEERQRAPLSSVGI